MTQIEFEVLLSRDAVTATTSDVVVVAPNEVLTSIGQRLKRESPFRRTMMVTHGNSSSGYIPDDAAYEQISYEIVTTRLQPGCAEDAIVKGLTAMMEQN